MDPPQQGSEHPEVLHTFLIAASIMALIILPQVCCPWNYYKAHED